MILDGYLLGFPLEVREFDQGFKLYMEPETPTKWKVQVTGLTHNPRLRKFVLIAISIVLILGGFVTYLIFKERMLMREKMRTYFTVVLDCGSTGSRVTVFEWEIGNGNRVGDFPVLLRSYPDNLTRSNGCQYHCMQTEPGLHNLVDNAVGVRASLEPLIKYAERWVPLEKRSATPIFILATAGMRSLTAETSDRVLEDVECVIKDHKFMHQRRWIRVLSGKEEAYYGWVALNYKMGIFRSSSRLPTSGILDLGGSSLQVVAEVDIKMKDEHAFRSKLGRAEHDIIAYSFPAFGLNEAFDRTVAMLSHTPALTESVVGSFEVRHPCLSSDFVQNYTCHGCFLLDPGVEGNENNPVKEHELNSVLLVGEPNLNQCEVIARAAAINSSSSELSHLHSLSNCAGLFSNGGNTKLNLTKKLHFVSRYHALSGFFAVYQALNLSEGVLNLTTLQDFRRKLCSKSSVNQKNFEGKYCFHLPYLISLIENALCLSDVEMIFGPGDVSWTLGASLLEGEFLWLHLGKPENGFFFLKENVKMPSPLLIFVLLVFLLLVVYHCEIKLPMPGRKVVSTRTMLPSFLYPKRQPN